MVRTSWRYMVFSLRTPLPKIISGHQPLLPRRTLLPFACRKAMDRIEMTVQRNHFASLWELSTHYVKALEQLMPKPLSRPLRSQKTIAFQFTKIQWVLPPGFSMETLELHVKRKRIQHEWGFPVLIQKSLRSFLYPPPSRSSVTKTKISVHNLAQALLFLPQDICKNLELHVQKTKLYHRWGLPQRVLGSLKKLQPEVKIWAPRPKTLVHQTRRTVSTYKTIPLFQTRTVLCTMCCKQRMVAIPPHVPHKLSFKGSNPLEKISLHISKKYVEIQLEVFPDVVMGSWKLNVLATRQPLPKLISHSPKILQPRRSFLPFMQKQEAKRLEMAVQLCYFNSLWGLGKRYVEAIDAMIPRSYASPFQRKKIPAGMFSEIQIPFLQQQEREFIELHIRKKRLHHDWGFPALIQSSLRVFMQGFPPRSTTHRTTINIRALPQKFSFLPWPTYNYLEFHLQKLKLQRRWGLPKKILESLKYFRPSAPLGKARLPPSAKKTKLTEARFCPGGNQRVCCKLLDSTHYAPKQLDLLKEHIRRKYLQRQLETLPRLVRQSHKDSGTMPQKHLPKLIEAGQKSPTHRAQSLLFLPPSDRNRLEQNVRHKHLVFLWGISKKYMESLSVVVPVRPFPAWTRNASVAFQELKTPFVQKEAREMLEHHIQKKRLHHFWGLPSIIQSSLLAFTTYLSIDRHPPRRIKQDVRSSVQDLPFVPERVQQNLASSIKKMVIHSQWGLPKKLQKFLHGFRPTPPGELREFRNFLVSGPKLKRAQRITRLPESSFVDGQHKKTSFLTNESIDLLERHIQHKKFQHEWGLPSVLQRSLRAFAPLPPEPQRALTRLAMAAPSRLQTEGRLTMTPKLLFLDPVTKECLEAHTKRHIARHKWGLPKQVQESIKTMLPPTYFRQPEDLIDRIPSGTRDQVYPARIKEISDTRDQHLPTNKKAQKRRSQIEDYGGRQLPWTAGGHPKSPSPRVRNRIPTLSGKVTPKFHQESWAETFYTKEVWDALEFHIRHKRIQHDWGLPLMVKKSLNAFAPHPPELHSATTRSGGRLSVKSRGKGATHQSLAMVQATIPRSELHFLSVEVNDHLEAHLKNWTVKHKWGLTKRLRGSLRTIAPPRPESQAGMHKPHGQHSRSAQPHKISSYHDRETSQRQVISKKGASKISNTLRHQGQSSAQGKPLFFTEENWNLLEFHIQQKKIQHDWGVPSMVLRSLNAFFPFPIKIQSPGKKRLRANQWVTKDIKVLVPSTFFLSKETKEVLEAHMKKKIAEHKWTVPKRLQQALGTLSTPKSHFRSKDFYRQAPLCRRCQLLLQTTDDSQTEKEEEEEDRRRKRRKKEYLQPRNRRRSTFSGRASKQHLLFSELRLPFLSDEARNYLEFHIQQKKIQRAWSLPSMVLRSLHAFAPFSPEIPQSTRKRIVKTQGWSKKEVVVIASDLPFLSQRTKDILEAHLKRRTAEHRWGMPKTIRKFLGSLVPSRPPSQHESIHEQPSLCWKCKSLLESTDVSQTEEEDEDLRDESKKARRRTRRAEQYFQPGNQRRSTSSGRASRQFLLFSEQGLSFLSDEARNYLEFHIQQKKIQRAWSLPSTVLRSLHAFAPFSPGIERRIQSTRKRIVKTHGWNRTEVAVIVPDLPFLSQRTKDILEAHLKRRTAEHRWGMPKTIKKLLGLFLPSRPPSQHESIHEQPPLCWKCKSLLTSTDVSQTEEEEDFLEESKKVRRRKRWKGKDFQPRKQRESTRVSPDGRQLLAPMEGRLSFLSDGARNYLEFHIQQKKIQRAWNLPSLVLKSLRAFAPFPLEDQKDVQDPRDRKTKHILWEKRDVPIDVQSPFFLSPDVEEHLDTHVRHITTKHQWGLLERVQQPLQAFLPLRSHSPSELEDEKEGSSERAKRRKVYRKANVMPSAKGHIEKSPIFYSEVKLTFFEDAAWNLLEFHIQHKKLQHAWGLPFMVLRSLDAFAPYLHDSTKRPLAVQGTLTTRKLPGGREFHMIAQNLSFLSSDTKQLLEAHLKNLVAVHRWGLPKHAQTTLRAFLHPGTLSSTAYKSPQISLPQTWVTDRSPMKEFQLRKKKAKLKVPVTSSTIYFRSRKMDFLDEGAQNLLEFHILHKKIQHTWGLPAIIQKSLRLFAPSESQKKPQSAGDVTMKTTAQKSWIAKEVRVAPQQLRFLHPDVKKQLESHIREVTVKHRWRLPKLVQDTLAAFIPQAEEMGEEMKEPFSTYDEDHLLRSSSSLGVPDMSDSELFYEHQQIPVEIRVSWLDTEEPSFCFDRKIQHDRSIQGKMARREAPEASKQHKLPLERTESDVYLKDEQRWAADLLGRTRDPRGPFFSTPVSGSQKRKYNATSSSESLSLGKYPSQRTGWLAREREALPCSSNLSLKKDLLKQLQSTSQRKEGDRYYPIGLKRSQLSKGSSFSWVPNSLCRICNCPCRCHLPSSREGSMFSLQSVRKQEETPGLIWGMVKEAETDSSSLLTEDRSSLPSISAKKEEVQFSSVTSEEAISESSLRDASLREQEATPSSTGDQGVPFQEERVFASDADLQKVTTSGSELPDTSRSSGQFSSSPKGMFFQEAMQPSLAVEQTSVLGYRKEGEQTVTEPGMEEPDGGKHSTTEMVDEKTLNWGTELSTKEPFMDRRPLIQHKRTKTPGSIQKRRKPTSERGQSTEPKKQVRHAQFLVSAEPDEKMSILGRILERKLRLRHGLNIWKYSRGRSQVFSRMKHKIDSFRHSFRVRSRTRSKDSSRRDQSRSPESTTRSRSSSGKARSRGRSRERRSKTEVRKKELPQKEL
ncbi:uncharacterized protein LOC117656302 [Pantherophis guttatus]|uniref:Uncharacterized protein LOC117656302 n=1 Tax=Pantherophis guttatus TaxID=94885 RepID=A0A6P9ASN5_PANGU|nr:uncharacterized protein LOC117656302 [Pantherophis guttatus]